MRSALISGANKGLGFATARLLGEKGVRIWLGSRSVEAGAAAAGQLRQAGIDARSVALDITDDASVGAAAARISAETGLDILINNAAIMDEGHAPATSHPSPSRVPLAALERSFATNLFGTIRLTQALLPILLRSRLPRIVNVSSRLGSFGHQTDPDWPGREVAKLGYSSSKAALNMMTVLLAYELRHTSAQVNAVTPGIIATDLNGAGADALRGRSGFASSETGAIPVVDLALAPEGGPSGKFFGPAGELPW